MDGWVNKGGTIEEWKDGRVKVYMDKNMEGWKDIWIRTWKGERMYGWEDGMVKVYME